MEFTLESTRRLAEELRATPPKDPAMRRLDKQAVINEIKQEIIALQQRGYTLEEVAEMLRSRGFEISTPTLKNYLQRAKGKDAKRRNTGRPPRPPRSGAGPSAAVAPAQPLGPAAARGEPVSEAKTPAVGPRAVASGKPTPDPALRSGKGAFLDKDRESY